MSDTVPGRTLQAGEPALGEAHESAVASEGPFRVFLEAAGSAAVLHDLQGRILDANRKAEELFGYSRRELVGLKVTDLNAPHSRHLTRRAAGELSETGSVRLEIELLRKSGEVFPGEISASVLEIAGRKLVQGNVRDLTLRRRLEVELEQAARTDPLTGVANRAFLRDRLAAAIGRARRRPDERFAAFVVDLDRFKKINQSLGHSNGDRLLRRFAERLRKCVGNGATIARTGSDEFAVLVAGVGGVIDARQAAERIQRSLGDPFAVDGHKLHSTVSIGIALSDPAHESPDDWLRAADAAIGRAKALGGGRMTVFDPSLDGGGFERLQLENDLRRAVRRGELELHFQPIVCLRSGTVLEVEALVRWLHPQRGLLEPDAFLPLADEVGELAAIDEWVLREACLAASAWRPRLRSRSPARIAVNVSSRQFTRLELLPLVDEILVESGLAPQNLRLEVTESAMIDDPESAVEVLSRLKERRVHVSLDDFGTGYSSLSYLHRFPVDTLKVDRSFVSGAGRGSEVIRAVVRLAEELGMEVTAEGVETAEELARVRQLGCGSGQGYYFSRPVGADAAGGLLAARRWW